MKSFKNFKKALTLVELIITVTISTVLMIIITMFVTDSMNDLFDTNKRVEAIDNWFEFKNTITRLIRGWYNDPTVLTWSITWMKNHVLYIKNYDLTEALLLWVVNIETRKLQQNYEYWKNYLWYRFLSNSEMIEIDWDNSKIFEKEFFIDKVFNWMTIKDFKVDLYNWNEIIDMYFSIIKRNYDDMYWESFSWFTIIPEDLMEFNLVF